MASSTDFELPLRPAASHYKMDESSGSSVDIGGHSKTSDQSIDKNHLDDSGNASEGNQTIHGKALNTFDLTSTRLSLPHINYSGHPNITMLPGLEFKLEYNGGFMTQPKSGLLGWMLLPYGAINESASRDGLVNVAKRIEQIMLKALRTYRTSNDSDAMELDTINAVFFLTFKKLRSDGKSWNFQSADRKMFAIINEILNARKRFLSNKDKELEVDPMFLPFQNAIDDVIRVVEGGLRNKAASKKSYNTLMDSRRKRDRYESSTDPWARVTKQSRISDSDADAEIDRKPLEEQVAFWRNRSKDTEEKNELLEINLMRANQQCQQLRDTASCIGANWSNRLQRLWGLVLPAVNRDFEQQGKQKWDENRLVPFLRKGGLHDDADAMMGKDQI
ncbi:hypothetical protein CkaCkLH20_09080 [Colletotrichum karsti]|uniref:Uncharacterized protein n=1 Tax=Colletotrichum karsti TaxID=1095194 RepID=A0A9P6HXW4_9PEZI|nr:uncharacterized protein CkaCkLH20_09080 [Colletotrichum karsti]KAF9873267.1 hypothetical protein CkaCkLH20_09080 [Colletotrichum karsti]